MLLIYHLIIGCLISFDSTLLYKAVREGSADEVTHLIAVYKNLDLNQDQKAFLNFCLGDYFIRAHDLDSALYSFHAGLELCENSGTALESRILDELSIVLRRLENSSKAIDYINRAIIIKEGRQNPKELARSLIIKGNVYYSSFTIENSDSAKYYYLKADKILPPSEIRNRAIINNNLGNIYIDEGQNEKGRVYLKLAGHFFNESGDNENSTYALANLANAMIEDREYAGAIHLLDSLGKECINHELTDPMTVVVNNLSIAHERMGNLDKAIYYKDSLLYIHHKIADKEQQAAEEKYKNDRLQSQLEKERADMLEKEVEVKSKQLWMSIFMALAALLSLLGFFIYRTSKFKQKELNSEIDRTKKEAELQAIRSKMEGEDQERQAVASVLHDHVSGLLSAASIHLNILKKKPNEESLSKADAIVQDANERIRDISHQLVSPSLIKFGLSPALDTLCKNASSVELVIDYDSDSDFPRLSRPIELFVYRTASELLNNVIKHSGATKASVQLKMDDQDLSLIVQDNGHGLNTDSQEGLGLTSLRSRSKAFGGSLQLTSIDGLKVELNLPLTLT